jgi:hypothetical protein
MNSSRQDCFVHDRSFPPIDYGPAKGSGKDRICLREKWPRGLDFTLSVRALCQSYQEWAPLMERLNVGIVSPSFRVCTPPRREAGPLEPLGQDRASRRTPQRRLRTARYLN